MAADTPRMDGSTLLRLLARVFLPFAGGYFLSYLFRNVNAVIAPQLVAELDLSAGDLGLLTAAYFFTFGAFQIPLGLLLDRYGPRRVQACLLLSAAVGSVVFGASPHVAVSVLGRGLIGLGVAGALMSAFTAFVLWFPRERLPLVNGFYLAFGGLGAIAATAPLEALLQVTDWRTIFVVLGGITAAVAAVILVTVPDAKRTAPVAGVGEQLRGVGEIYRDRLFWRVAPITFTTLAMGFAVTGLWGGPWLRDIAGLDREGVAAHLFGSAIGLVIGSISGGVMVEVFKRMGMGILGVIGLLAAVFLVAQAALILEMTAASYLILGIFGFMINAGSLAYPALSQRFPTEYAGRVNTSLNVLVIGSAFAAQYLMGWIIDFWPLTETGGYHPDAYRVAFLSVFVLEIAAFVHFLRPHREG